MSDDLTPSTWLTGNSDLLPRTGRALDVACGRGRHALWLGARGLNTTALDRDAAAVHFVNDEAGRRSIPVLAEVRELEVDGVSLGAAVYDVIVVVHYLHRPLFPALMAALRPGGLLVYETFTRAQAARGKPTNPAFLLDSGELQALVRPLEILREREGDFDGRMVAAVIARRPARRGASSSVKLCLTSRRAGPETVGRRSSCSSSTRGHVCMHSCRSSSRSQHDRCRSSSRA